MSKVIEPLYEDKKLTAYLEELKPAKVLIIFWHGLGDLVMFLNPYGKLRELYPNVEFTLAVQRGLSFEDVVPDAYFIGGEEMDKLEELPYDLIAKVHFPMSEGQTELTKGEWCCVHELGIKPTNGHQLLPRKPNKLVAVHFNITCLPESANPDHDTAQAIWEDILEAGYIPIETHFEHTFHNPTNAKFDFVDCSVRRVRPRIETLIGLLQQCTAGVFVVSGNFHVALATLPPARIFFLEKHFKFECFSHLPVARASIKPGEYPKGSVKQWLQNLHI